MKSSPLSQPRNPSSSSSSTTVTTHINPVGVDGVVRCYKHSRSAAKYTSNSANNPGREFYRCGLQFDDKDRCDFFKWADELPAAPPSSTLAPGPSTPPRSQTARSQPKSSPSLSQSKLSPRFPGSQYSPTLTPEQRRQKRFADIQAGVALAQADSPPKPSQASQSNSPVQTQSAQGQGTPGGGKSSRFEAILEGLAQSQPESSPSTGVTHLEDDVDVFSTPPQGKNASTPGSASYKLNDLPGERSPKRARLDADEDADADPMLLTPPMTLDRTAPTKGKARAPTPGALQDPSNDDDDDDEDPAHPLGDSALSADALARVLPRIPEHVRRLERRVRAADKAGAAKARRIAELEREIEGLRGRVRVLEETVGAVEARR